MASICCSPPERVSACWPARALRMGKRRYTNVQVRLARPCRGGPNSPGRGFPRRSAPGRGRGPRAHRRCPGARCAPAPGGECVRPMNSMVPFLGWSLSRPAMVLSRVVLPAPLGPRTVKISSSFTSRDKPVERVDAVVVQGFDAGDLEQRGHGCSPLLANVEYRSRPPAWVHGPLRHSVFYIRRSAVCLPSAPVLGYPMTGPWMTDTRDRIRFRIPHSEFRIRDLVPSSRHPYPLPSPR